jgi:hypothetical protein
MIVSQAHADLSVMRGLTSASKLRDASEPSDAGHGARDQRRRGAGGGLRAVSDAGATGARTTQEPAGTESLFAACAGGRMHRQGQGAPALRVRRQGLALAHRRGPRLSRPARAQVQGLSFRSETGRQQSDQHFSGAPSFQANTKSPHARRRSMRGSLSTRSARSNIHVFRSTAS